MNQIKEEQQRLPHVDESAEVPEEVWDSLREKIGGKSAEYWELLKQVDDHIPKDKKFTKEDWLDLFETLALFKVRVIQRYYDRQDEGER